MTANFPKTTWQHLESRPHPWRKQLYIKGRKLRAFTLQANMIANSLTPEEAADNWELPLAAISEVMKYCAQNQKLLQQEAKEEKRRLETAGVKLEPEIIN